MGREAMEVCVIQATEGVTPHRSGSISCSNGGSTADLMQEVWLHQLGCQAQTTQRGLEGLSQPLCGSVGPVPFSLT